MSADPYAQLAIAVNRLKEPLQELTNIHDNFVLQSVSVINNVKSIREVRRSVEQGLKK